MITNKTVIISCAGIGKRLGWGIPKALVKINDETLIARTFKLLNDVQDVRIVIGYQAEKVAKEAIKHRKDLTFVFNHDYLNTGTGSSVIKAAKYAKDYILTIDGDVIIHPDDMKNLLANENEFVGVTEISTENPVAVKISQNLATGFSTQQNNNSYEWTGTTQLKTTHLANTSGHTLSLVEPNLPLPIQKIRMMEIDTEQDYVKACDWVNNNYHYPPPRS